MGTIENVIIIGGGPAGHTAAIYTANALLSPLMFEGFMAGDIPPGGQLTLTSDIENFPGFPEGIGGVKLMQEMKKQSIRLGARVETKTVDKVDLSSSPFKVIVGGETYETKTLIIATGATAQRLKLPGENKYRQRGISACAVCDGGLPIFREKRILIVGGGDTACEEALYLTRFASEVHMIVRRDVFRASKTMQNKALNHPKITIHRNTEASECIGEQFLSGVKVKNNKTGEEKLIECNGLFYAIGHKPNTEFLEGQVEIDEDGYIITKSKSTTTNIPGVFCAGDVQDRIFRQAITSAGTGCMAGLEAERFLEEHK